MIVAAALCPGPPLLVRELSGADPSAAILRQACGAAVAELVATNPDLVAVVGTADRTKEWPETARPDLSSYGPALPRPAVVAPLSVGLGALLLDQIAYQGPIRLQTLDAAAPETLGKKIAEELDAAADRVGLLVVADGSARRSLKAPGYFDPRAEPYDCGRAAGDRDRRSRRATDARPGPGARAHGVRLGRTAGACCGVR